MEDCALWAYSLILHKRGPLFVGPVSVMENGDKVTVPKKKKKKLRKGRKEGNTSRKRPQSSFLIKRRLHLKIILLVTTFPPFGII